MSAGDQPLGSLPFAWLGGALAAALFALLMHLGLIVVAAPNMIVAALVEMPNFLLYAVAIAGGMMLLLVGIMRFLERDDTPESLRVWLRAGLISSSPLALLAVLLANSGDPVAGAAQFDYRTLLAPLFVLACGLVGALAAFRIRHGSWR